MLYKRGGDFMLEFMGEKKASLMEKIGKFVVVFSSLYLLGHILVWIFR